MSTNHSHVEELAAAKTYAAINNSIRSLGTIDMEMENTAVAETASGRVARLTQVYGAVKPLLTVLGTLPLIPASWRAALMLFISSLDAVIAVAPQPDPVFKAGKDL